MKRFNQTITIISVIVILISLFIYLDHKSYLKVNPNDSANSGIGSMMIFLGMFYITRGIAIIMFILTIVLNILNKSYLQMHFFINVILLVITFEIVFILGKIF